MNNFLVVQIRDGFLPADMTIVLQAGLAEERIQMAFTEGYPEIQRHLVQRQQEQTKRSGRRKKFDAAVRARFCLSRSACGCQALTRSCSACRCPESSASTRSS